MNRRLNRALTFALGTLFAFSILGVVYISVAPPPPSAGDEFTELYVLGPNGTAADYPEQLKPGEKHDLILGIVNHEARTVTYQLVVQWNTTTTQRRSVELENEESWEHTLGIRAPEEPGWYWLSIGLDIAGQETDGSYRSVRLRVRVR